MPGFVALLPRVLPRNVARKPYGVTTKNCCIHKGIDWQARSAPPRLPLPASRSKTVPLPDFAVLGPYQVVDARLKEVARTTPGPAAWKGLVERLSDRTPEQERMRTYEAIR